MKAFIKHISYYVPEKKLTNDELAVLFPEWDADSIFQRTGIKERGISAENELSSDKAVKAANLLFSEYDIDISTIDFLIFCTQTPDYITPSSACLIQHRLGLKKSIGALDVNLGCTGFVYILGLAKGMIEANIARNILLLNSESLTGLLHPKDKSSRIVFGDAATAVLVSGRDNQGIGEFVFGTNGVGADYMIIKAGGFRNPFKDNIITEFTDDTGNTSSDEFFYMKGTSILSFTLDVGPKMVNELLQMTSQTKDDIDYYIFHQANAFVLQLLQKKLNIPSERFCINLSNTGNTVSCTIPIALRDSLDTGKIKQGDKVMCVSFGVGLSWAATIITV